MLRKTQNIRTVREPHSAWQWKISHPFPPGCRFCIPLPGYFRFLKDGKGLYWEIHTGYSWVECDHTGFKLIGTSPLNEQSSTKPCASSVPRAELWVGSQPVQLVPRDLKQQSDFFSLALPSSGPKARNPSNQTQTKPEIRENIRVCKIQALLAAESSQT